MKSHQYQCTPRQLGSAVVPTVVILLAMAALLRTAEHWRFLPAVPATADPDTTVLRHQAFASRNAGPANILLVGDSTCLVGVDALDLSHRMPGQPQVLSLALFIWMSLETYGEQAANFIRTHPGQVQAVVLLVTPPKLAGPPQGEMGERLWRSTTDPQGVWPAADNGNDWLGAQALRRHVLAHFLSTPLRGSGGAQFGFSSGIVNYLNEHRGSLITFGTYATPRGTAKGESSLSPDMEADSRAFRAKLPAGVKLFIGLTPGPEGTCTTNSAQARAEMLCRWNEWLRADAILTNLPASLPDAFFAGGGHLNAVGQKRFTVALAKELGALLR